MGVMDELVYNAIDGYYKVLGKLGSFSYKDVYKLLLLSFYRNFVFEDYRGLLSKEDYREIEMALYCLFGSNCLIPYPDYLKMGKLHIGEMTEMAQRVKTLEDTKVLKKNDIADALSDMSDVMLVEEEE